MAVELKNKGWNAITIVGFPYCRPLTTINLIKIVLKFMMLLHKRNKWDEDIHNFILKLSFLWLNKDFFNGRPWFLWQQQDQHMNTFNYMKRFPKLSQFLTESILIIELVESKYLLSGLVILAFHFLFLHFLVPIKPKVSDNWLSLLAWNS